MACPRMYLLRSSLIFGSWVRNPVLSVKASTTKMIVTTAPIAPAAMMSSVYTLCILSCLFCPRYFPHRMLAPPVSTIAVVVTRMFTGL